MGLFRRAAPQTKAISQRDYAEAFVSYADTSHTKYSVNIKARELLPYCVGLPLTLGDINARNCVAVPCRLYRMATVSGGGPRKRGERLVGKAVRAKLDAGRMGTKAAEWASIGGDVVEVTEHEVLDLLNQPNPHTIGTLHDHSMFCDLQHFGETFEGAVDWDRYGISLNRMAPPYVEPMITGDNGIEYIRSYAFGRDRSSVREFDPEDVGHYKMACSLLDPWHGRGFLEACYLAASVLNESEGFDENETKNGLKPAILIETVGMSDEQKKATMKSMVEAAKSKANRALRTLWINNSAASGHGVTNIKPFSVNHRELQTVERLAVHRQRVLSSYGVPESMYQMNDANLASSVSGNRQYLEQTVQTMCGIMAAHRTEFILRFFGIEPGVYFLAYDDPTENVTTDRVTNLTAQVSSGMMTINEAREDLMLKPVEGGDIPRVAGVPLDQVGALGMPLPPLDSGDRAGEVAENIRYAEENALELPAATSGEDEEPVQIVASTRGKSATAEPPKVSRAVVDPYAPEPCCCYETKGVGDWLSSLPQAVQIFYRSLVPSIADVLADMEESALAQLGAGVAAADLTFDDFAEQLGSLLGGDDGLPRVMLEGADKASRQVGGTGISFDVVPPRVQAEVDKYLIRLSEDLSDHTRAEIVRVVDQGVAQGRTIDEITKEIQTSGIATEGRAERIARTETANAVGAGQYAQYEEMGISKVKSITAPGASPEHAYIERATASGVPVGEPIVGPGSKIGTSVGDETYERPIFHPPYRPNCRCDVIPVQE